MTTIFNGYDDEYKSLVHSISTKIDEVPSYRDALEKQNAIVEADNMIKEAMQLIQQMDLEVRSLNAAMKRELSKKIKQYRDNMKLHTENLNQIHENEEKDKLFDSAQARERMQAATQKLEHTSTRITAAQRAVLEIEETAMGIQEELSRNHETIKATHNKVNCVNDITKAAEGIVDQMITRNKRRNFFGIFGA
ncbi:hypothetical protein THRCLA_20156 [Thraustotheca clavata]|uniref:Vesicle transport v-SNARE N-terminal domain-containing protein n=1 Tax=Thraustotheca clavata TaxID=74557 RepID=A0A1W0AAZ2_9STRA|nr:hypothetical protein THRCLA_20156 [Thraustotheca clavata]